MLMLHSRALGQFAPELLQPRNPFMWKVTRDDRRIDGSDSGAGNPVRPDTAPL
jgi:hypothetical protein